MSMFETIFPFLFKIIDRIIPDETARQAAKLELVKTENQQALNEIQASLSAILAEANSDDPWTSRARPSFLYVMYVVICSCFIGGIIGIWYPAQTTQAAANINALLKAIPSDLYTLFGMGYLGYTGARSFDKWRKLK
ncbi:MAG: holin family protein [Alphaproteobacteria bacterium]|nr:holin family protein [Alphaproteobacteria bacterium]